MNSLRTKAVEENKDVHLRTTETGLKVIIEANQRGDILIPLKNWGELIGQGNSKKIKLAVLASNPEMPVVALSSQAIYSKADKHCSDNEVRILQKIESFKKLNPDAKGLIEYFGHVDYTSKTIEESPCPISSLNAQKNGYDSSRIDNFNQDHLIKSVKRMKRAIACHYYRSGNLKDNLQNISYENKVEITRHILDGLESLHSLGIFHSDLKPDNILLQLDEETNDVTDSVIGDFGYSCDLTNPEDRYFKDGHHDYRAPEIAVLKPGMKLPNFESVLAADVYSMGLIINEIFGQEIPATIKFLTDQMTRFNSTERPTAKEATIGFKNIAI